MQDAIDQAGSPEQAYSIFAAYTGSPDSRFIDRYKNLKVDIRLFRNKLKHMARVVTDYPELKHMIGNMNVMEPNRINLMYTHGTHGGTRKVEFEYNKYEDRAGPEADRARAREDKKLKNAKVPFHTTTRDYDGTHEMGHALASLLVESDGTREALFRNTNSTDILLQK